MSDVVPVATAHPHLPSDSTAVPAIRTVGLHKAYGFFSKKPVLQGIDLEVPRGAVLGLVGTNGEGKSTLIKCLLGLLRPTSGRAEVLGEDPWDLSPEAKARIGYVPQEPALIPWLTVRQSINYTASFYETWDHGYSKHLVAQWALPWDDRVGVMSLGQKQKMALVLALGHRPDLLILDEPVASLDPIARRKFLESLVEITADEEHTVLFSTHITSDLERIASHLAIMKGGKIVFHDELDVLKDRVKRLRIHATSSLPSDLHVPGALRVEVRGHQALVAVSDATESLIAELKERCRAEVTVEDLNLEDIFVELHE